jgi:hypothetical protein
MASVLKKQESEFLRAYRAHMYNVQKELAMLRAKADDAAVQLAKNDRIRQLEAERDWYRTEALRLDQFCTGLKADVEFMRDKLAALEDDRDWLESQLKGAKRSNAILRAEGGAGLLDDAGSTAGPPAADSPARSPGSRVGSVVGPQAPAHAMAVQNPVLAGTTAAAQAGHGPRLRKGSSIAAPATLSLSLASARGGAQTQGQGGRVGSAGSVSRLHSALAAAAALESAEGDAGSSGTAPAAALPASSAAAAGQLRALQAQVRDLSEQLATASASAESLKAKNTRLKAANTALRSGRGELESFFLQVGVSCRVYPLCVGPCIPRHVGLSGPPTPPPPPPPPLCLPAQCVEDVRKEVSRRRVKAITIGAGGTAATTGAGGVPTGLLPQLKNGGAAAGAGGGGGGGNTASRKSLFASASAAALATQYSDGGSGSLPMPAALGNDHAVDRAVALAKARQVGLDEFTPLDRRAVIARLLEDEFVLHALYGVVFKAHAAETGGAPPPLPPALAEIAQLQLTASGAPPGGEAEEGGAAAKRRPLMGGGSFGSDSEGGGGGGVAAESKVA